jgi:hypothetical protein
MPSQVLIYLTDIEKAQEHGLPWHSVDSARWDHRHRHERGTADAFFYIGRRPVVDPARYHALIRRGHS